MTNRTDEVSQLVKALKYEHETLGLTDFDFGVLADNIERIVASAITSAVEAERERCAKVLATSCKCDGVCCSCGMERAASTIRQTPTQEGV